MWIGGRGGHKDDAEDAEQNVPAATTAEPVIPTPTPEVILYPDEATRAEIAMANLDVFPDDLDYVVSATTMTVSTGGSVLNVRRGTSAVVYIDGQAVKSIPETSIPAVTGHYMFVGGEETLQAADGSGQGGCTNLFHGDVDEIRIWNAAIGSDILADRRFERLDNEYAGLIGYFPMELIDRESSGNITSTFSLDNFGDPKSKLKIESKQNKSLNAPALLPGSSRIRLADTDFDFTVSADEIYFSFQETMYPLMDGNEFAVTVKNIKDEHNNLSEPVMWKFLCDFAIIDWLGDDIDITKDVDETLQFTATVINKIGSGSQSYEISGLPSWMTVDQAISTMNTATKDCKLTVLPSAPIGRHTVYITLTDRQGIKRMKTVNVTVTGDVPDWAVNEKLYESNMQVTGQIYIDDKICEYTDSKIAAFDSDGNCRGTGSPRYVETRDAYYVDMVIYGGAASELTTAVRDLTFKYYDASTGRTYPLVVLKIGDDDPSLSLSYSPDAVYGSYDNPVEFIAANVLEQRQTLEKGWSWISFYVQPLFPTLDLLLPTNTSDRSKLMNVKGHKEFATYNKKENTLTGQLTAFYPGIMYKVQVSSKLEWPMYGSLINVAEMGQTISEGYNWIGTLSSKVMSPADAFADLRPQKGDMVKNRTTSATYNGQGVWEGTLKSIVPGQGYIYLSKDTETKTFHYPALSTNSSAQAAQFTMDDMVTETGLSTYFTPVDEHRFPDNMNMIAVVKKDGLLIENAEVAAFVNDECRGAVTFIDGYYFLSILGSSNDDLYSPVEIRVYVDGEEYTNVDTRQFISDGMIGDLDNPYVLDLDATAIRTIAIDEAEDDNEWYTLQGQKLGKRPTQQGVYIHKGEKVVVKRSHAPIPYPTGEGRR